jgi:hypothetical protein
MVAIDVAQNSRCARRTGPCRELTRMHTDSQSEQAKLVNIGENKSPHPHFYAELAKPCDYARTWRAGWMRPAGRKIRSWY